VRTLYDDAGQVAAPDLEAIVELVRACDVVVLGEPDAGREDVVGMLATPRSDRMAGVLVEDDRGLLGVVYVELDHDADETWVDVYADPRRRTAEVLDSGLAYGLDVARAHRDAAPEAPSWVVRSGCFGTDDLATENLAAHGFRLERRFWRMRRDLRDVSPSLPPVPADVEIRVARDDADRRRIHAVHQASFADHWNHVPRAYDEWLAAARALEADDPEGWWLLEVDGVPAAVCLLDDSRAELGDGYVRILGVLRQYRGAGLATLLLQRAFAHYAALGRVGVQLTVDSDSPTGANRLYEGVGMTASRVIDSWFLQLARE
jgi:GNAT superfamily N-acetyltransferase